MIAVLYSGEPITVRWWHPGAGERDPGGGHAVDGVVEIAETAAGSLVMRTGSERVLCPGGTWGRIAWPAPAE